MSSYLSLLVTAWRHAREDRPRFALAYGMFVLVNAIEAIEPLIYGWFIDAVQRAPADAVRAALTFGAGVVAVRFFSWCLHGPARVIELSLALSLAGNFLNERFRQTLGLPVEWHQNHHSGATINRVRKAYEALREFFMEGFVYIQSFCKLAFCLAAMSWFSPRLGLVVGLISAVTLYATTRFDRSIIRLRREYNEADHAVSANLFDTLSNITTVITLRLERSMAAGLKRRLGAYAAPFRGFSILNEWKWFTSTMFVALIYVTLAVGYTIENRSADGAFPVGGLVALLAYGQQFASVFYNFAAQYNRIVRLNVDLESAGEIADAWRALGAPENAPELPPAWRRIAIDDVHFSHADARKGATLADIDLTLRRGKRIALVGESGSGKSTLLALLRGLYAPAPGARLEIDGRPAPLATLNAATTLLPQEPEIFENTILYNITLGLPFAEEDVMRACDLAQFSSVARALPKGLATDIREKGVNLSGGQKQRLALARGLLAARDCAIVLFDEPTSSVDPRTEALIYEAVFEACRDKVLVSALHRLHLLRDFDEIYVLRDGRVVGRGTLEELLSTCPEFQDMWRHQAEPAGAQEN